MIGDFMRTLVTSTTNLEMPNEQLSSLLHRLVRGCERRVRNRGLVGSASSQTGIRDRRSEFLRRVHIRWLKFERPQFRWLLGRRQIVQSLLTTHGSLAIHGLLAESATSYGWGLMGQHLIAALAFSVLGILILILSVWVMCRLTPFSVRKEIEEDHNTAVAIVMGAVLLGMAIIIAASITG